MKARINSIREAHCSSGNLVKMLQVELSEVKAQRDALRDALEMVRDADEDCHRDGLKTIPPIARHKIDTALATLTEKLS